MQHSRPMTLVFARPLPGVRSLSGQRPGLRHEDQYVLERQSVPMDFERWPRRPMGYGKRESALSISQARRHASRGTGFRRNGLR
jgi:hypothetical protein